MRILIAEDDQALADDLSRILRASGYAVDVVESGDEAQSALFVQPYNLVVLEHDLPRVAGLEILRRLRSRNINTPVLVLTSAEGVEQGVRSLDLGADDYMAKPLSYSEFEARVRALTRRALGNGQNLLRHGALSLDTVGRVASINDVALELSGRELGLLETLLQRAGRLVSKEQLVDHLCEWGDEVSNNAIEVYVHRLRKKLEPGGVRIATVRGLGYCLERPADVRSDSFAGAYAAKPS